MSVTASAVAAASAAWVRSPTGAQATEDDEYTIVRLPDHHDVGLSVVSFTPAGPLGDAVDAVLERARTFGLPTLDWQVLIGSPPGLAAELTARGAHLTRDLELLAADLTRGAPPLPPPTVDVSLRWATDLVTARDGALIETAGFGGELPPDDRIEAAAANDARTVPSGRGGMVVAYVDGRPAATGSVAIVDGVARLTGGTVAPPWRRRGLYRAVLDARLTYAAAHGATTALVRADTATSGPILRRAGFTSFGPEPGYTVPLAIVRNRRRSGRPRP